MKNNLIPVCPRVGSCVLVLLSFLLTSYGQEDPSKHVIANFSCADVPVSKAISQLSENSAWPINSIIDQTTEPFVSISTSGTTIGDLLTRILAGLPHYHFVVASGTILVAPSGLETNRSFVLNHVFHKYTATYGVWKTRLPKEVYKLDFYDEQSIRLNVAIGTLILKTKPEVEAFPQTLSFADKSLVEILNDVSKRSHSSWCCARVFPSEVVDSNQTMAKMGYPPMWQHVDKPCYMVTWNSGGHHGIDPNVRAGVESLTASDVKPYRDRIQANRRGSPNADRSPIKFEASVAAVNSLNQSVPLVLKLINRTDHRVIITNPFLDDPQRGFWQIIRLVGTKGNPINYRVLLPHASQEPAMITLDAHQTYERTVDLRSVPMELDKLQGYESDGKPRGKETENFVAGNYWLVVNVFFQDDAGTPYYLIEPQAHQFEIRDRTTDGK